MIYRVMCRVSGGVTGTREALLMDRDGEARGFATREEAEAEAKRLTDAVRAQDHGASRASFRYWAVKD